MALTRNDEIAVLLEFNTRLVGGDPPAVLLPRIVEEAERLTGGDAVVIRLLEGDWLVLSTCSSRAEALNLEKRLPAEAGIVGRVARDGVPLMSRDIAGDERFYAPHLAAVLAAGF
ncbi:MAG TPA: GAF domain-containing protein, partial [Chloroflexota bacterium]|nr:GAF domain-containing protein [Chloroflexota bacterium]